MADKANQRVTVKLLSALDLYMRERGLAAVLEVEVPDYGISARELAAELELPPEMVEAVFINGRAKSLDTTVLPGDQVALVPPGTPGPYRVLLGMKNKT